MAKRITVKYSYIQYEPGDKLLVLYDAREYAFPQGETLTEGSIVTVSDFSRGDDEWPDLVWLDEYPGKYVADDFELHPSQTIKED